MTVRNGVFALATALIFAVVVGVSIGILLTQSMLLGLGLIAIILALVVPTYYATLFNAWSGPRLNDDLVRRLGDRNPQSSAGSASVLPAVNIQGSARISESATAFQIPPPETVRDHLRVQRFLREAPLPNENSRRNAQTWLRFLEVTQPYLVAQLPPEPAAQIGGIRSEVSKESFRLLRNEVTAFFRKNQMAWPIVTSPPTPVRAASPPSQSGQASASRQGFDLTQGSKAPSDRSIVQAEAGTRPVRTMAFRLLTEVWTIAAGEHHEWDQEFGRGARLSGFAKELDNQTFDLYVMDRPNYVRFLEDRGSREEFEALDRTAVDFEVTIPHESVWYVVVDTYRKQVERRVQVELRLLLSSS